MNEDKVNSIGLKISKALIEAGMKMLKLVFKTGPAIYTAAEIRAFLNQFGFPSLSLADEKYYVEKWTTIQKIINYDWTEEKPWYADYYDCDNHAFSFASRVAELFDLNSMGVAFGQIYDKDGKFISGHAFNLIIATDDEGKLGLYLFESQNDNSEKWMKGQKNTIAGWEYRINWVIYY